ncbi:GmrSD restriction endonuclease domain-containing protein [Lactiplantibacillus plantarum]|uniref:GmrSD restriction endonuclease domain-containing protein n=1 Tax=Lactiplantibacillus plantarum TaxID=1590 RepID=UPI003F52F6FC
MKININSQLSRAASFNPTKQSQTKSVFDMCSDIENERITLPLYQRDLSWNVDKAIQLFNYQMFGKAPVAPISMNQIGESNTIPQISFISRERINTLQPQGVLSIVDGQQRLTTNFKAYIDDESFENIVLDVTKAAFKEIKNEPRPNQVPVGVLLNKDSSKLRNYLESQGTLDKLYASLLEVRSKMTNYSYTVHIAKDLNEDEQIEWFDVLNTAGSRVTGIQLAFSKIKLHDFDIYKNYVEPFKDKLNAYGLDELMTPFTTKVSYPIVSLNPAYEVKFNDSIHGANYAPIPSDTKEKALVQLNKKQLEELSNTTLIALEKALSLIYNNNLGYKINKIDYVLYLTGYFVFHDGELTSENEVNLIDWISNVKLINKTNKERRDEYTNLLSVE